jgi:hypothetical protein
MVFIFAAASFSSRLVTNCSSSSCVGFQGQIEAATKEQGGKGEVREVRCEVREAGRQQSWALMINAFNHDWAQQINSKLISPGLQALLFYLSLRQSHTQIMTRSPEGVVQDVEGAPPWLLSPSPRDQSFRSAILSCAFCLRKGS